MALQTRLQLDYISVVVSLFSHRDMKPFETGETRPGLSSLGLCASPR